MKLRILFLSVMLLFIGSSAFSQGFTLGLKGGANMGKISGQAFKDQFTLGYQVGGFATIPLGSRLAFQPEVLFNQSNVDTANKFSEIYAFNKINNIKLDVLTIPLMLNYNLNKYFALQAGPQFGIVLSQDKNLLQDGKDAFKSGTFSLAGGAQVSLSKFRVYGRFVGGLTNLDNVGDKETWKFTAIQLGVGLAL